MTINFRQGPLGFMSTANDDLPANLGLWDQNFALKWVQSNIKDFGGDPSKVTELTDLNYLFHFLMRLWDGIPDPVLPKFLKSILLRIEVKIAQKYSNTYKVKNSIPIIVQSKMP